jgi:hypothetical protein
VGRKGKLKKKELAGVEKFTKLYSVEGENVYKS